MQREIPRTKVIQNTNQGTSPPQEEFPLSGNVRPAQSAKYLGIGLSSFWLFIKQNRIERPLKFSSRVSTHSAEYIRFLAGTGIPSLDEVAEGVEADCKENETKRAATKSVDGNG